MQALLPNNPWKEKLDNFIHPVWRTKTHDWIIYNQVNDRIKANLESHLIQLFFFMQNIPNSFMKDGCLASV